MTAPKSWVQAWADKHNRSLLTQSMGWGTGLVAALALPVATGHDAALLVIDNQTDKTLTATLQQLVRIDDAQAQSFVECEPVGEDTEILTITNAVAGVGTGIPAAVEIFHPGEADADLSVVANINESGQTVVTIVLGTDALGALDPAKNTAALIVAAINGDGGEDPGIEVAAAEYSGDGTGVVSIELGEGEDRFVVPFINGELERWGDVYDSDGNLLELTVATTIRKMFGPFNHFPRFLGGQVTLTAAEAPTEGGLVTVQLQGL